MFGYEKSLNLIAKFFLFKSFFMGAVKDILLKKGNVVHSISPDISVYDALEVLEDKNLGGLVVAENGRLVGIFTERDYARKVVLKGRSSKETLVRDIMTGQPIFVNSNTSIDICMQLMSDKTIRHLPVVDHGDLVGIISIGDLVKYIISEKDYIINTLEHYIVS